MPWISNYVHNKLYDVITDPYHDFNGVVVKQVWIRDCIPYKTMDVFTYPCLNLSFCFLTRRAEYIHRKLYWSPIPTSKQHDSLPQDVAMMSPSNGNIFRVAGPLWGESTGHRSIPLTRTSDAKLWCLPWSAPEQTTAQTIETAIISDAIKLIMTSL